MLKLDNDYVKISLSDGIYYAHYKPIIISLRIAKEIVKERQKLTLGKKYPFIVDIREVKGFKMDAVNYLSGNESADDVSRLGVVVNSKFIVNLYRLFSIVAPPRIPTNLFTTNKEAKEWIYS
jgi:hypothetical protein